jgi:MFS family permease
VVQERKAIKVRDSDEVSSIGQPQLKRRPKLEVALRPLRRPDFFKLWSGLAVSQVGSQVTQVAVAYQVYLLTHSALSLGLIGLFRFLPITIAAFVAGPLADARDRRKLMLVTQSTLLINSAAMAMLSYQGRVTPTVIYAFVALSGLGFAFDGPARHSLVPSLVPAGELPNALSLNITVFQLATVIGPGLAGILLRYGGPALAYTVDTVSFLGLLIALLRMEYRAPLVAKPLKISLSAFRDGLRFVAGSPEILWLMLLDFVATFFAGSLLLLPVFADQIFHVGVRGLGLLYAAPAVGAVLAALSMAALPAVEREGPVVLGSVAVYGAAVAFFGLSRSFPLAFLFLALSGAADTVSMVVRNTVRQLRTPDSLRGRMTSLNQLFFVGGPQLGEVEAGVVARLTTPALSVVSGGLACILATLVVGLSVPRLRRLRRLDPKVSA